MTIDDVVDMALRRAQEERSLAVQYEADGFPLAAMPHDVVGAAMESFARTIAVMNQDGGHMDDRL